MAFEESIRLVKNTQKNLVATETGVEKAQAAYDEISRDIRNAQARLRRKLSNERGEVVARATVKSLQAGNLLETTLIENIDTAAIGTEFESDVYISKLYQVANSKDIYNLIMVGAGWNSHLATLISFEEEGGRLEDYARGIRAYRASLGTKTGEVGSNRGLRATNWWYEHVYQNTLEEKTVEGRVGISARVAPFWKILDAGSQPLASDRPDDSYNPVVQTPTGFIIKAEIAINKLFDESFKKVKADEFAQADELKAEIDNAKEVQAGMKEDLRALTTDLARNQRVLNNLGVKSSYADRDKLAKMIRRIDEGEKNLPQRVNIGMKGKSLTISIKKLEGLIND